MSATTCSCVTDGRSTYGTSESSTPLVRNTLHRMGERSGVAWRGVACLSGAYGGTSSNADGSLGCRKNDSSTSSTALKIGKPRPIVRYFLSRFCARSTLNCEREEREERERERAREALQLGAPYVFVEHLEYHGVELLPSRHFVWI